MTKEGFWLIVIGFFAAAIVAWVTSFANQAEGLTSLISLSRLAAAVGMSSLALQYVLASRAMIIEGRIGQDKLFGYHRWVGRAAVSFLFLHFLLLGYRDLAAGVGLAITPGRIVGMTVLFLVSLTAASASLHGKLGLRYECWKAPHLLNYLAFPAIGLHLVLVTTPGSNAAYLYLPLLAIFALLFLHRLRGLHGVRTDPYRVSAVIPEAEGIWTLRFEGSPLRHDPGQFMHVQLLRDDQLSSSHPFTISSSPTDPYLSITPKESGDFTATLGQTGEGDLAYIDAPYGVFSYLGHPHDGPLVFIAGGIGITPFMSMLRYMRERDPERDVLLLWGNRSEGVTPFLDELAEMAAEMPRMDYRLIMSDQSDWPGEKGRIERETIERHVDDLASSEFYVCGPPPMLHAMLGHLRDLGVPEDRIHYELFQL